MRSALGAALLVLALAILFLLLGADPLFAHDCSSIQDCLQTSGYNGVVSVTGGAIAIGSGLLGTQLADPGLGVVDDGTDEGEGEDDGDGEGEEEPTDEKEDEPKKEEEPPHAGPPNPCQSALDRFDKARTQRRVAEAELAKMREQVTAWDNQWEQVREQGFVNAGIDLAFTVASTAAGGGALGLNVPQSLLEKVAENMLLGTIKDMGKFGVKAATGDKPTFDDFRDGTYGTTSSSMPDATGFADWVSKLTGMPKSARDKLLEEAMAHAFKNSLGEGLAGDLAKANADTFSLIDTMLEAKDKHDQLDYLRQLISNKQQVIDAFQHKIDFDLNAEIEFAQSDLDNCKNGELYQRYLKHLEFLKLPSQG